MSGISGLSGYQIRCNGCYEWRDGYNSCVCNYCGLKYCSRNCFQNTCYYCQQCGIQKHICNFNGSGIRNVCRKCAGK